MAINVNTVYITVLSILNKEQRGYLTPFEFNQVATQVQLDIFERDFEDLNQQLRVPQADFDYSNRQIDIDDNISTFKCIGDCAFGNGKFSLPTTDDTTGSTVVYNDDPTSSQFSFYRLGTITYQKPGASHPNEIERLQRIDYYNINKSKLTAPSKNYPVYLYESNSLFISPSSVTNGVKASFLRKPKNVVWNFTSTNGYYEYDESNSVDFELNLSEQTNVITRVLLYAGVVIKDPTIIQVASQQIQQEEQNSKI